MPRSSSKKQIVRQNKAGGRTRGEPPPESVIAVEEFTSPKTKRTYRVIETNETDAYDRIKQSKNKKAGRAKKGSRRR